MIGNSQQSVIFSFSLVNSTILSIAILCHLIYASEQCCRLILRALEISVISRKRRNLIQSDRHPYYSKSTGQKMKFSIKDSFSKCDQIHRFLQIWSHLPKKSLMENFIFCTEKVTTKIVSKRFVKYNFTISIIFPFA